MLDIDDHDIYKKVLKVNGNLYDRWKTIRVLVRFGRNVVDIFGNQVKCFVTVKIDRFHERTETLCNFSRLRLVSRSHYSLSRARKPKYNT